MEKIKVKLREKTISNGTKKSLYLDYYPPLTDHRGKQTRREFLNLYLFTKPKNKDERRLNESAKEEANIIWVMRQDQLIKGDLSFIGSKQDESPEALMKELLQEAHNPTSIRHYSSLPQMVKEYAGTAVLTYEMFTPDFCQGYINSLKNRDSEGNGRTGKPIGNATQAGYSTAFLKFINRAEQRDRLFNVAKKLKGIRQHTGAQRNYLTLEELRKLAETPVPEYRQRCRDACLFSAFTGLRQGDILNLSWQNIVEENGKHYIYFKQEKAETTEYFPLNSTAFSFLGERKKGKVFEGVTRGRIEYMLENWIPAAGIDKHITFHAFRHTFATQLVKKGVNISIIQKLMGHKILNTTLRYTHVDTDDKQNAVDKLDF